MRLKLFFLSSIIIFPWVHDFFLSQQIKKDINDYPDIKNMPLQKLARHYQYLSESNRKSFEAHLFANKAKPEPYLVNREVACRSKLRIGRNVTKNKM